MNGAGRPVLRWMGALLCAAPVAAHLAAHGVTPGGPEGTRLSGLLAGAVLALAFCGPLALALRRPAAAWAVALGASFCLPLVPVILRAVPVAAERVAVLGALAGLCIAWPAAGRRGGARAWGFASVASAALLAAAALSIGSGVGAAIANLRGSPGWAAAAVGGALSDYLLARPMIDPTHPLSVLALRLEGLALAGFGLRLFAEPEHRAPRALLAAAAWALPLGLAVALADQIAGSVYRGESALARLAQGLARSHRPLLDHNALGSALVLMLPLALAFLLRARGRGFGVFALGVGSGGLLLAASRSKAAFGGALVALGVAGLLALPGRGRLRAVALGAGAVLGLCLLALQAVPREDLARLESTKFGGDLVRTLRVDAAVDYLAENRLGPWIAAAGMARAHPFTGVGLGNFPRELAGYRDAERELAFNPEVENAHSQTLQTAAEEGLLGLGAVAVLAVLLGLGLIGACARLEGAARAAAIALGGGLCGLSVNLQLGHSVLEPSVAHWLGGAVGAGLGLGVRSREQGLERGSDTVSRSFAWSLPVALLLMLAAGVPQALRPARPLLGRSLGLGPATLRAETGRRDRVAGPSARWIAAWPEGDTWIVEAREILPITEPGARRLALEVRALERTAAPTRIEKQLGRSDNPRMGNPPTYLRLRRPEGVQPDELVEIRASVDWAWFQTAAHLTGREPLGCRLFDPVLER